MRKLAGSALIQELPVGEMCVRSDDFARIWAEHTVRRCTDGFKELDHPIAGRFDVSFEVLHAADSTGQRLLTHSPIDDIGERALSLLALEADDTNERSVTRDAPVGS